MDDLCSGGLHPGDRLVIPPAPDRAFEAGQIELGLDEAILAGPVLDETIGNAERERG
jgi:hypothetical protein